MNKISPTPNLLSSAPLPASMPNVTPEPSASPKASGSAPHSFAQMLERNRPAAPAPAAAKPAANPPAAQHGAANEARHPAQSTSTAQRPNAAAKPADERPRGDEAETPNAKARTETSDDDTNADTSATSSTASADRGASTDAALTQWLAGLQLPPAPTTAVPAAGTTPQTPGTAEAGDASPSDKRAAVRIDTKVDTGGTGTGTGTTVPLGTADGAPFGQVAGTPARDAATGGIDKAARDAGLAVTETKAQGDALTVQTEPAERADRNKPAATSIDAPQWLTAAAQAGLTTASAASSSAAASTPVAVPAAVNSPEFPQVLGSQLSLLVQDGVEHAELHLNPADMGPVSVQISVDGGQARIDFGADVAATRQAIENALPELASALADAGLTLTGGGVSQHSRPRQDDSGARAGSTGFNAGTRRVDGDLADTPAPAARRAMARGGVDLYA